MHSESALKSVVTPGRCLILRCSPVTSKTLMRKCGTAFKEASGRQNSPSSPPARACSGDDDARPSIRLRERKQAVAVLMARLAVDRVHDCCESVVFVRCQLGDLAARGRDGGSRILFFSHVKIALKRN